MEFLVRFDFDYPDQATAERVIVEERARGNELQKSGVLLRIWRDPGRKTNWILWKARDATEFNAIFSALPAYPYFRNIQVFALAAHPIDPGHGA